MKNTQTVISYFLYVLLHKITLKEGKNAETGCIKKNAARF